LTQSSVVAEFAKNFGVVRAARETETLGEFRYEYAGEFRYEKRR